MTNAEYFLKDEVSAREFREKLAQFIFEEVGFYEGTEEAIGDFLDMIKKPTLTEVERVILKNVEKKYVTVRRIGWNIQVDTEDKEEFACICAFNHLFKFIKEGEEYNIEELLKGDN